MTRFYMVRHGETDWILQDRYQGHAPVPLNQTGIAQAEAVKQRLSSLPLEAMYTSDLKRAVQTARIAAGGRTVVLDPRLREADTGRVTGWVDAEIAAREPDFWAAYERDPDRTPFPGGEAVTDVGRRVMEATHAIARRYPNGHVAIVAHAGVIRLVLCEMLGVPVHQRRQFSVPNGSLTILDWTERSRLALAIGDTSHLQ